MLTHLDIENYALIDHLDMDLDRGFTAITGETGAGKSILVDALELVLGKRADTQCLLDPGRKCIVEATFSVRDYGLKPYFEDEGLDFEDTAILRREIHPNGKSRAFINDTPVNLNQLKVLVDRLVAIHAQHATTSLQDPGFHLSVIDSYAGTQDILLAYLLKYSALKKAIGDLARLRAQEEQERSSLEYKQFLLDELTAAGIDPEEQDQLEEKLTILTHAEDIKSTLFQVQGYLEDDENSALNLLSQAINSLAKVQTYHPSLAPLIERLNSDLIDLKDLGTEFTRLGEDIEFNAEQQSLVQQRLELLYRLQHKHHVQSNGQLIELAANLAAEVSHFESLENEIFGLEKLLSSLDSELDDLYAKLTAVRISSFKKLEIEIMAYLVHMGIPEAQFEIRHELSEEKTPEGNDRIEFYFNANRGHSLKPLAEIASGGELSRVMLSIKSIISHKRLLPTIIFDEIDNGLSGDIAGRVGDVLISASSRIQVIAVTHLPQIAGKAHHHFSVFKHQKNNVTFSNIKSLGQQERVAELAKMIGGREITNASLAAANELLTSTPKNI